MEPQTPGMNTLDDQATFTRLAERHRRELQVHCYGPGKRARRKTTRT
jgi:hypothetical protein